MDEIVDDSGDLICFDSLGHWRTILNDDGKYEKVFVAGTDILRPLKIILR